MRHNTYDAGRAGGSSSTDERAAAFAANLRTTRTSSRRARRVRDPPRALSRSREAAPARGLLLLDGLGRGDGAPRRRRSPTRTTGRTSRSSATAPTGEAVVWTGVSIIMLLAGIGAMVWYYVVAAAAPGSRRVVPPRDPLAGLALTPSQKATLKYFCVVSALILVADPARRRHRALRRRGPRLLRLPARGLAALQPSPAPGTSSSASSGSPRPGSRPASSSAPLVSGVEPKGQRLGVNVLFGALLLVVVGSLAGEWLAIMSKLSGDAALLLRPPGLRVRRPRPRLADRPLRRPRPVALPDGARDRAGAAPPRRAAPAPAAVPASRPRRHRPLLRRRPHLGPADAPLDRRVLALVGRPPLGRGLLRGLRHGRDRLLLHEAGARSRAGWRAAAALLSATIFLSGGIIGTLHHLYFAGTPTSALAFGAVFSALEVVPLVARRLRAPGRTCGMSRAAAVDAATTAGRSTSSWRSPSGTWSAPASSAS